MIGQAPDIVALVCTQQAVLITKLLGPDQRGTFRTCCCTSSHEPFDTFAHHRHAGLEPRGFFNVVQFVMSDRESVGSVSLQEAMQLVRKELRLLSRQH